MTAEKVNALRMLLCVSFVTVSAISLEVVFSIFFGFELEHKEPDSEIKMFLYARKPCFRRLPLFLNSGGNSFFIFLFVKSYQTYLKTVLKLA